MNIKGNLTATNLKRLYLENTNIISNIIGSFLVRGGALVLALFTLPAYMNYFGDQRVLGLWYTALSVLSWILTFDLGIGNGLRNHLVGALVVGDTVKAKQYISSSYIMTGLVVIATYTVSYFLFPYIRWNTVFNISDTIISQKTLLEVVHIIFMGIMLQFLLRLVTSVLFAFQKSAIPSFLILISTAIQLISVLSIKSHDAETNLKTMAIVYVLAVNVPLIVASILVFSTKMKKVRPSFRFFDKGIAASVMRLGGTFFWIQIMYMIITTTNEFLITWFVGPEKVVEYQIYNRLFFLVGSIFSMALTPIWSAVTKEFSRKNYTWINKLYKILIYLAGLAVLCEMLFIPLLQFIVNIWLGDNAIKVNYFYALAFAISGSIFIWNAVLSSIANGIGELKPQLILFTFAAFAKIPVAFLIYQFYNGWITVIVANIVVMIPYSIIQPIWLKKVLNKNYMEVSKNVQK